MNETSSEESDYHNDGTDDEEDSYSSSENEEISDDDDEEEESVSTTSSDESSDSNSGVPRKSSTRPKRSRSHKSSAETDIAATEKTAKRESRSSSCGEGEGSEQSSSGSSKSCPICLVHFKKDKYVAIPDGGCTHTFCYECLKEWSKNIATCPIDRSTFRNIIVKESIDGKEIKRERVRQQRIISEQDEQDEDAGEHFDNITPCSSPLSVPAILISMGTESGNQHMG